MMKGNGRISDLGALLGSTYDEEFSFRRVEGKFVGGKPKVEGVKDVSKSGEGRRVMGRSEGDV